MSGVREVPQLTRATWHGWMSTRLRRPGRMAAWPCCSITPVELVRDQADDGSD